MRDRKLSEAIALRAYLDETLLPALRAEADDQA